MASSFQPTHPHGVRHVRMIQQAVRYLVSTHAPARGATAQSRRSTGFNEVSTHAPARGATRYSPDDVITVGVSTHAPARGATVGSPLLEILPCVSTHAPARGATSQGCDSPHALRFQPTHPHGVRHRATSYRRETASFNPRTRTGCDECLAVMARIIAYVSTHAPARGATSGRS